MVKISTAEARSRFSKYISIVETQHERIVIEKRGRKVAIIIPFPNIPTNLVLTTVTSLTTLDALPSRVDSFIGIVKETDFDYRNSRTEYLLTKYL